MRIVVHLSGFYDWEPVPADVEVTDADVKAKRVKPSNDGRWLMRVTKKGDTHTDAHLPENELIELLIHDMIRDRQVLDREQAVARYMARHVMPHHAHRAWMKDFDVQDDGPDESLFDQMLKPHVAAGNIDQDDFEAMREAYTKPADVASHCDVLHGHFGTKKAKAQASKSVKEG
jgi:hypothetical protein